MKKKIILPIIITLLLIVIIGATYAVYTYTNTSSNKQLLAGNIYLNYEGTNGINMTNTMPGVDYSNYYEFTISGANKSSSSIYYDIILLKGDLPSDKTENNRISDKFLKFKLVEVNNTEETVLVTDVSYNELNNKKIYVANVASNKASYSKTYRLYMTITGDLTIGTNSDYTMDEWSNVFASVKVKVTGDFTERTADKGINLDMKSLISLAVSYQTASNSNFTGGLVAINNSGTLYNENSSTETIREYRYTGLNVNNYVFFDTDGDGVKEDNEIWRIVGIFKNSDSEWNLKLMRNTLLTIEELPTNYTYSQTSFTVKDSDNYAYFSSIKTGTNYNDFSTASLQYFLNDATSGYLSTISNISQKKVDRSYTYYLGKNIYGSSGDTTVTAYTNERDASNIYSGSPATWSGAVALLYPSDYGYSANSSYWSNTKLYSYGSASATSWMQQNANHTYEWLISPSARGSDFVAYWHANGPIGGGYAYYSDAVRPCLNLLSTVKIDTNHTGTLEDTYEIKLGDN